MDNSVLGLTGLIFTVVFGGGAIWLSIYLFIKSHELNNITIELLHKIGTTTSQIELMSKEMLHPVVSTIISILRESTRTQIDSIGGGFISKLGKKIDRVLEATTQEEKEEARKDFINETRSLLGKMRGEIGKVGLSLESEYMLTPRKVEAALVNLQPGSIEYDWIPFIRTVRDIENTRTRGFLSIKWLRETKFRNNKEYQDALQISIDNSILIVYMIDNPNKSAYQVKCCKLNKEHPTVAQALSILNGKASAKIGKKA